MEDAFERFWQSYPKRLGTQGKAEARKRFMRIIAHGESPEKIISGADQYWGEMDRLKKIGTEFVLMAQTWLNRRVWEDYEDVPAQPILSEARRAELMARFHKQQANI